MTGWQRAGLGGAGGEELRRYARLLGKKEGASVAVIHETQRLRRGPGEGDAMTEVEIKRPEKMRAGGNRDGQGGERQGAVTQAKCALNMGFGGRVAQPFGVLYDSENLVTAAGDDTHD